MKTTVLDSYAVISYLQQQEGYKEVATVFEECVIKDREAFMCIVNWGEVIYQALRKGRRNPRKVGRRFHTGSADSAR